MWQKVAKFKGAEYFRKALYICKQSLNIRQGGIVSLNPCNGYCYRFQAANHSLPKYIIQEDPVDGSVHIGRP